MIMKRLLLSVALMLFVSFLTLHAQYQDMGTVYKSNCVVGRNLKTHTDIEAVQYVFPKTIVGFDTDSLRSDLYVQLRNYKESGDSVKADKWGELIAYDLERERVKWNKRINFKKDDIRIWDNNIFQNNRLRSQRLNQNTGEVLWETPGYMMYVNSAGGYGVSIDTEYKLVQEQLFAIFSGIEMSSGTVKWKRNISPAMPSRTLNYIDTVADSAFLIDAQGLHCINYENGEGWDNTMVKFNYSMFASEQDSYLSNFLTSNVVTDSTNAYLASSKELVSLSLRNGDCYWKTPLPADKWAYTLFVENNMLYLFGKDFKNTMSPSPVLFGAYNTLSGEEQFRSTLKCDSVVDYFPCNDTLYILSTDEITSYKMSNGLYIAEKTINLSNGDELQRFFEENMVYFETNDTHKYPRMPDSSQLYVMTKSQEIIILNHSLQVVNKVRKGNWYVYSGSYNQYKFYSNTEDTIVLDGDNALVATLNLASRARIIKGELLEWRNNRMVSLKLSKWFP